MDRIKFYDPENEFSSTNKLRPVPVMCLFYLQTRHCSLANYSKSDLSFSLRTLVRERSLNHYSRTNKVLIESNKSSNKSQTLLAVPHCIVNSFFCWPCHFPWKNPTFNLIKIKTPSVLNISVSKAHFNILVSFVLNLYFHRIKILLLFFRLGLYYYYHLFNLNRITTSTPPGRLTSNKDVALCFCQQPENGTSAE